MLLRSKPYDHILQLSTITCRYNNKFHRTELIFPSLSSTDSGFELTLTLIIITDLSVPKHVLTPIFLNSEARNFCRICSIYMYSKKNLKLHQSTAASTWWCGPRPRLGWVKMAVGLLKGLSYRGYFPPTNYFFAVQPPERPQKGSMQPL